jgi:hypothetical protein
MGEQRPYDRRVRLNGGADGCFPAESLFGSCSLPPVFYLPVDSFETPFYLDDWEKK